MKMYFKTIVAALALFIKSLLLSLVRTVTLFLVFCLCKQSNGVFFSFHITSGRGLKSGENFKLLYDLADKLNAAGNKGKNSHLLPVFTKRSF